MESTHASRNPLMARIQGTSRPLTKDQEARRKVTKARTEALLADYEAFNKRRLEEMKEIAERHSIKLSAVQRDLSTDPKKKKKRAVSIQNALVHFKAEEMNEGLPKGQRHTNQEILDAVKADRETYELSSGEESEIIHAFEEIRVVKSQGARVSNRAATADYTQNTKVIQAEIKNLGARTGAAGFALLGRGHIADGMGSTYFATEEDVLGFFPEVLGRTASEVSVLFDAWTAARKGGRQKDNILETRKECARMITEGLNQIIGKRGVDMRYSRYDTDVRAKYNVKIVGWPCGDNIISPHDISRADDIRRLRDALKSGECHWAAMTRQEIAELNKTLNEKPKKPRKQRSDKNIPRGPRKNTKPGKRSADNNEKENEPPCKKRKVTSIANKLPPGVKNKALVDNTNDSEDAGDAD